MSLSRFTLRSQDAQNRGRGATQHVPGAAAAGIDAGATAAAKCVRLAPLCQHGASACTPMNDTSFLLAHTIVKPIVSQPVLRDCTCQCLQAAGGAHAGAGAAGSAQ
jgi:hypothetical protein